MSDYTTLFKAWLEDVQRRGKTAETESEIKGIEQCLKRITIQKLKDENESLKKRLEDARQNDNDSETSIPDQYCTNRTVDRRKALDAGNDSTFLNNTLKEIFSFCLRSAIQQLTDLKKILHPEGQESTTVYGKTATADVKKLHELKRDDPNIAELQRLTKRQSLTNLKNTFYSEHSEYQSNHKNIKDYIDSCLNLCWNMCSSNPVTYFIWEEDNKKNLFRVDDSGGKGNLEVVWPALVQICDQGYKKLVEGLKQRKGDKENSNKNIGNMIETSNTTLKQDSSAAVPTAETTVHVPGIDVSNSETRTTKDKKKNILKKTNEKRGNPSNPSSGQKTGKHISKITVEKTIADTEGASKPNSSVSQKGAHTSPIESLDF